MARNKKSKDKKKLKKKKKKGVVDKLVMGGIIGGAIGSVIGMSVAPKSGRETRKYIKDKGKEMMDEYGDDIDNFKNTAKSKSSKFWKSMKKKLLKWKKK
jgi:gas vesicle protein